MNKLLYIILVFSFFMQNKNSLAISPEQKEPVNNSFLFIENNVDNEFFIASTKLDPRFTGANTWVKHSPKQVSLGYMGVVTWPRTSTESYMDIWLENSQINTPFSGVRCTTNNERCPTESHYPADKVDKLGFYHAKTRGVGTSGGRYAFAAFTDSAFEYFRSMSVGVTEILNLNHCLSRQYYPLEERCIDQTYADWTKTDFSITKIGQLTLNSIDILQKVWVGSDGTPNIGMGKEFCEVGGVGNDSGIICKTISYSFNVTDTSQLDSIFVNMIPNHSVAKSPESNDLQFSGDGKNWTNYDSKQTLVSTIFKPSGNYVYTFISNKYLKSLIMNGSTEKHETIYTFSFTNRKLKESGYYEFTPSLRLSLIPREYSISIVSSNNMEHSSGEGIIGSYKPIEIEYTITISGRQQANDITAQVYGKGVRIDGVPYCLFSSTEGDFSVPIPALLQYVNKTGRVEKISNSCIEDALNLNDAFWQQSPWDVNSIDEGNYYSTNLKLIFPMNLPRSNKTDLGNEWQGIVSANGEIRVSASWNGVGK